MWTVRAYKLAALATALQAVAAVPSPNSKALSARDRISIVIDTKGAHVAPTDEPCSELWCDHHCLDEGHLDGTCDVHGKCVCIDSSAETKHRFLAKFHEGNCHNAGCNEHCHHEHKSDGRCLPDNQCYCKGEGAGMTKEKTTDEPCSELWCDHHCLDEGHLDGTCDVHGKCVCIDSSADTKHRFLAKFHEGNCHNAGCNEHCHHEHKSDGRCLPDNQCYCKGEGAGMMLNSKPHHNRYPFTANALCDNADCAAYCEEHENKDGRCTAQSDCVCEGSVLKKNGGVKKTDVLCDNTDCIEECRERGNDDGRCDAVGTCICKKLETESELKL